MAFPDADGSQSTLARREADTQDVDGVSVREPGGLEIAEHRDDIRLETAPKISIVTPTLNRAEMIETAIHSVIRQGYPNVEHIIVDAQSSDDTLERLERYPQLRVVSEPDDGLYDAYNKGVQLASGDVVAFLNDDDYYEEGALLEVAKAFQSPLRPEIVTGWSTGVKKRSEGGHEYDRVVTEKMSDHLTLDTLNLEPSEVVINARFFAKHLFEKVGGIDTRYPVGADWDFMLRVALYRPRAAYVQQVVHRYREHEHQVSFGRDREMTYAAFQERLAIVENLLASSSVAAANKKALRNLYSSMAIEAMGVGLSESPRRWDQVKRFGLKGARRDPTFVWRLTTRSVERARSRR